MKSNNQPTSGVGQKFLLVITLVLFLSLFAVLLIFVIFKPATYPKPKLISSATPAAVSTPTATPKSGCDPTLWKHVYNPKRLKVIEDCKEVTGTVEAIDAELDGDYHILLRPDSQFANLVNQLNLEKFAGDLVVEAICELKPQREGALKSCQGYKSSLQIPKIGGHVRVLGSYVLDLGHGWTEIHPVSSIVVE